MGDELNTETAETSKLENALSAEAEESSEQENAETANEAEDTEEKESAETEAEEEKKEGEKESKFTPEQEKEINRRAKAQSDESLKTYQNKREGDLKEIGQLKDQIRELKTQARDAGDSKLLKILRDSGEDEGDSEQTIASRESAVKEFLDREKDYLENKDDLADTVKAIDEIAKGIDEEVAKEFGLEDANPSVRAKGGMALIAEAVRMYQEMAAFELILEEVPVLKNGSDVRKQIDGFKAQYLDPELGKAGRRRLIEDLKRDFKVTPKEKPGTTSSKSSSENSLNTGTPEQKMKAAFNAQDRKR